MEPRLNQRDFLRVPSQSDSSCPGEELGFFHLEGELVSWEAGARTCSLPSLPRGSLGGPGWADPPSAPQEQPGRTLEDMQFVPPHLYDFHSIPRAFQT